MKIDSFTNQSYSFRHISLNKTTLAFFKQVNLTNRSSSSSSSSSNWYRLLKHQLLALEVEVYFNLDISRSHLSSEEAIKYLVVALLNRLLLILLEV